MAVLCALIATQLPDNAYQRYQTMDGTIYGNLRWIYERIHFDTRPIDVAFTGASRAQLGISAGRVEADLKAAGAPAHVVNFAVIADGRDLQWAILDELMRARPARLVVLAVNERPGRWGHPAFKYVAPARAQFDPATVGLHDFFYRVSYLPFRQLRLFAALLFPSVSGLAKRFDPALYVREPNDFTDSHRLASGKWIEMRKPVDRAKLLAGARDWEIHPPTSIVPAALTRITDADDRVYVRAIGEEARAHGAKVAFLFIPYFSAPRTIGNLDVYCRYGPVLDPSALLVDKDPLWQGWAHLNHAGAMVLSDWVAGRLAPMLSGSRAPIDGDVCPR